MSEIQSPPDNETKGLTKAVETQDGDLIVSDELYKRMSFRGGFKSVRLGRNYSAEEKIRTAALWLMGHSSYELEPILQIPAETIRTWMVSSWWKDLLKELRRAKNDELDIMLTRVMHKTAKQLEDRVENGNYKFNPKTGEQERVPLSSSELAKDGLGIPFDKRALTRGDATSRRENVEVNQEAMLEQLANQFAKIVKQNEPKVIDVEVITDISE